MSTNSPVYSRATSQTERRQQLEQVLLHTDTGFTQAELSRRLHIHKSTMFPTSVGMTIGVVAPSSRS